MRIKEIFASIMALFLSFRMALILGRVIVAFDVVVLVHIVL
jgi:hypothetical protein